MELPLALAPYGLLALVAAACLEEVQRWESLESVEIFP